MSIMKPKIYRASFIPYINHPETGIEMLFMTPSDSEYGGECMQIAKGKIELGETDIKAALREAEEELGLIKDNIDELFKMGVYLGRTTVFLGRIKDKNHFNKPHFETKFTS